MKFNKYCVIALSSFILMLGACQTEASKKADQVKADSLEKQTQRSADSALKAQEDYINSTDDSKITNDTVGPQKPAK
jgi:hypothetical protein